MAMAAKLAGFSSNLSGAVSVDESKYSLFSKLSSTTMQTGGILAAKMIVDHMAMHQLQDQKRNSPRTTKYVAEEVAWRYEEDEEANDTRDQTRNASEATSKAARDFEESYAWVTRKYKPGMQWFEVAFIGYKVVTVSSTRECILFIGAQCV